MSEIVLVGDSERLAITRLDMYSDNTPMVKIDPEWDLTQFHTMVLRPSSLKNFVTAMFLVDAINWNGGWVRTLVLPYVPGARQDRSNRDGDILFSAFSVAHMINSRAFGKVVILDPHSEVTPRLINRVTEYPLEDLASRMWQGYTGVLAPDKGAKARAEKFAAAMGKEITYASKTRDVSTGRLSGFEVSVEEGAHYLVVDDICDGGGTFIGLGEKIREQGAFADLYVTHGIFSKGTDMLHKIYKNIYTTDSLPQDSARGVLTIPVVERMI